MFPPTAGSTARSWQSSFHSCRSENTLLFIPAPPDIRIATAMLATAQKSYAKSSGSSCLPLARENHKCKGMPIFSIGGHTFSFILSIKKRALNQARLVFLPLIAVTRSVSRAVNILELKLPLVWKKEQLFYY